ncbi:putative membrane-anchored protein [Saccharomonospora amisosensis]|uniref:Putative membrane-anchored protein n=1 Tax=Saccharomonospora amisosensis TaxID=1128677 RepID=A0A7X5UP75_9PSEU|nr:putative cytokinetic ring protein SteA [Saccharomonospora amisosensis]NIJ11551.1 putative membrane-anchored protein [Saccharomonospora amisosensis]
MKLTGLLSRSKETLPGTAGTARVDRNTRELLRRVGRGDIAVLDEVDLDRTTANALVRAGVAAVVNAAPSISGRYPNLGPELIVGAGIPLVDRVGGEALRRIKDGSKLRVHEADVYSGDTLVAAGTVQTAETIADQMIEAKAGMSTQLEAFSANTIEFLRRERALILDGVGVPQVGVRLRDRHVLVVAPGTDHAEDLRALRKYVAEHRPVLVGIDAGADTLRGQGHTADIVVGDPNNVRAETLKECAEVIVPAQPDGHAPGLERIQDLGISAATFPASGNPEDLALLLAEAGGASLVVTVGFQATLREFLDNGRSGSNPSTFLTRLKLGTRLVDGKAVAALHRSRVSVGAVVLLVVAALLAMLTALLASKVGDVYLDWAGDTWGSFTSWVKGLAG